MQAFDDNRAPGGRRRDYKASDRVYHVIYGTGTISPLISQVGTEDLPVIFDQTPPHQVDAGPMYRNVVWVPIDEVSLMRGPQGLSIGEVVSKINERNPKYVVLNPPGRMNRLKDRFVVRLATLTSPNDPTRVGIIVCIELQELERTRATHDEVLDFATSKRIGTTVWKKNVPSYYLSQAEFESVIGTLTRNL
jgi:hypothetical protein